MAEGEFPEGDESSATTGIVRTARKGGASAGSRVFDACVFLKLNIEGM